MTSPDESFRNALLQSAADDGPAPAALDRELARLGLATVAGTVALTAASGATAKVCAASLFSTTFAKVAILATVALVGAGGYVATREQGPGAPTTGSMPTTAEPLATTSTATPVVATATPVVATTEPVVTAPVIVTAPEPVAAAPAKEKAVARTITSAAIAEERTRTLAAEVALIDRARTLARSSPGESMAALDEYARTFPGGTLRDEAAVVRVEALLAAGRRSDAERTAQPYLRDRPNTPIARRLSDLLGPKKDPIP